jgi:ketosteroid isomerase-like protein
MERIGVLLFIIMISCSCGRAPVTDTQKEKDALLAIEQKWGEAAHAADVGGMLSVYSPDAIIMQPDEPLIVEQQTYRKALESWLTQLVDPRAQKYTIDQVEVSSSGDLAFTRGTMNYKQKTPDGIIDYSGKWLTIYKKINGKWTVIVDISNSDNPMPTPALKNN